MKVDNLCTVVASNGDAEAERPGRVKVVVSVSVSVDCVRLGIVEGGSKPKSNPADTDGDGDGNGEGIGLMLISSPSAALFGSVWTEFWDSADETVVSVDDLRVSESFRSALSSPRPSRISLVVI